MLHTPSPLTLAYGEPDGTRGARADADVHGYAKADEQSYRNGCARADGQRTVGRASELNREKAGNT